MLGEKVPLRKIAECYATAVKLCVLSLVKLPLVIKTAYREELRKNKKP